MPREDEARFRYQHQGPGLNSRGLEKWEVVAAGPFVCFRPFTLLGRDYAPGDPVPLDAAEARVLRNLYTARRIQVADNVEVVAVIPAPTPTTATDDTAPPADPVLEPILEGDVVAVESNRPAPVRRRRGRPPRVAVIASA